MQLERIPSYRSYDIQAYSERTSSARWWVFFTLFGPAALGGGEGKRGRSRRMAIWAVGAGRVGNRAGVRALRPANRDVPDRDRRQLGRPYLEARARTAAAGIADFFRFIDVSESHPFSGTGNLVKFAEGLAKIDVQNQILFVFDNDAEGLDAHQRLSKLTLPMNMRGIMLPELEEFRAFPAQGPEGFHNSDINRLAAAIECYLDLDVGGHPPAKVLWTNYKKDLGTYQGALEYKNSYMKEFLKQTPETLAKGPYDVRKIEAVLDLLVAECTAIAIDQWDPADVAR